MSWEKVKGYCWHSLTIGWAYVLIAGGVLVEVLPPLASVLGAPELSDAMRSILPGDWSGLWTLFVGAVTFLARLRSVPTVPEPE